MDCFHQTVHPNGWNSSGLETDLPATDVDVLFIPQEQPGEERERVKEILHQQYGLTLTSCQRLDGFDDANYLVTVDGHRLHTNLQMPSSTQYVLRIINAQDSREPERIRAINEAMKHVHAKGIFTQLPVANLQGKEISFCTMDVGATSTKHVVVLRTFVAGSSMASLVLTTTDLFNCGVLVSHLTLAFEDFHHPFFDTFQFSWSIDNRHSFMKRLPSIEDSSQRRLLEEIMDTVDQKLTQVRHKLKRGQIHGDLGTSNIILPHGSDFPEPQGQGNGSDSPGPQGQGSTHHKTPAVTRWGIIDFHDTHSSYRLYELASTAARIMSKHQPVLLNRLDVPGHVLAGYQTAMTLDSGEREVFPYLVLSCLCTSVVGGQYHCSLNPGNAEYVQKSLCYGMLALKSLWEMRPRQAQIRWEQIAQGYHDQSEGH